MVCVSCITLITLIRPRSTKPVRALRGDLPYFQAVDLASDASEPEGDGSDDAVDRGAARVSPYATGGGSGQARSPMGPAAVSRREVCDSAEDSSSSSDSHSDFSDGDAFVNDGDVSVNDDDDAPGSLLSRHCDLEVVLLSCNLSGHHSSPSPFYPPAAYFSPFPAKAKGQEAVREPRCKSTSHSSGSVARALAHVNRRLARVGRRVQPLLCASSNSSNSSSKSSSSWVEVEPGVAVLPAAHGGDVEGTRGG
jgi:hypothetical protein